MVRSFAVLAFIVGIGSTAVYVGQRRTIAKGEVLAADIAAHYKTLRAIECDPAIEIGVEGARFACKVTYVTGIVEHLQFSMNRAGVIMVPERASSSDPWAH